MTKFLLALLLTTAANADILYSNTATDTNFDVSFSDNGFVQIGDQLQLVSAGSLDSLSTQFYNEGSDATFDAVLQFYNVGSPVGSEIGGSFTVTGISIAGGTAENVTFADLGGLAVPQDLIVMLSIQNVSANGDIGVEFFDPPTVGTSDDSFYIASTDGTTFSQVSTNFNIDNLNFEITTPEPATLGVTSAALVLLAWRRRRK